MSNRTLSLSLDDVIPIIEETLRIGQSVRFSPRGISMLPMLRQGIDSVVLSPLPEALQKYDLPLYQRNDGKYILHRIVAVGDTYTCIGDNQFAFEKGIEHKQIIALCTAITRDGKTQSVYSMKWRVYAIFRHYSRFPRRIVRGLCRRIKRLLKIGKV